MIVTFNFSMRLALGSLECLTNGSLTTRGSAIAGSSTLLLVNKPTWVLRYGLIFEPQSLPY